MIYTVTMNPAIDCTIPVPDLAYGRVNRAAAEEIRFGGKGINVSQVLKEFGAASVVTGFVAGFTGDALESGLTAAGMQCDFVSLCEGNTRINVKLSDDSNSDTEINAPGPVPTADELRALADKISKIPVGDTVVIAGSLPAGVGVDYIRTITSAVRDGVNLVCDLSGDALRVSLEAAPFLVKPNVHELYDLLGIPQTDDNLSDVALVGKCAERLISMGAKNALITMGADGAYFISDSGDNRFIPTPKISPRGNALSAVGCGDSTVAGLLIGMGLAGDAARDFAYESAGVTSPAELAVTLGTASYFNGFPPSPEKLHLTEA